MLDLLTLETLIYCILLTAIPLILTKSMSRMITFSVFASFVFFGALAISLTLLVHELTSVQSWQQFGMNLPPIIGTTLFGVLIKLADATKTIVKLPA